MIPQSKKSRAIRALLISAVVHLCLMIAWTFLFHNSEKGEFDDAIDVEFLDKESLQKPRRKLLKPPLTKQLLATRKSQSTTTDQPRTVKLRTTLNPINETVRPLPDSLFRNTTTNQDNPQDLLPEVMTNTQRIYSREAPIPESVTSRFQEDDEDGVKSYRQRLSGDGSNGLHSVESTGASDVGIVGDRPGKGEGGTGGKIDANNPFAHALKRIADHIISTRETDKVNIVFVVDTSASMRDNIQQVADHLNTMTVAFETINLEYHLGMTEFSVRREGQRVKANSLRRDVGLIRRNMQQARLSGDEHALDALVDTLNHIEFHPDADKHLVLVTDEHATTSMAITANATKEMRARVIQECLRKEIRTNVLGFTEPFQKRIAEETGGLWQEIPGGLSQATSLPSSRIDNEKFLKIFRDIVKEMRQNSRVSLFSMDLELRHELDAKGNSISKKILRTFKKQKRPLSARAFIQRKKEGHDWFILDGRSTYTIKRVNDKLNVYLGHYVESRSIPNEIDVIIMLDYSRSMGGKSEAVMLGISTLIGRLDLLPISYKIQLIRFAEAKDAIKSVDGTVVTKGFLSESQIKTFLEAPFGGDEHLIDAIVEGLPKIAFRPNSARVLLVLTDEPSTGSLTEDRAIEVCQSLGIQAYVVGHPSDAFQLALAEKTGGRLFAMSNHLSKRYPYQ
ncbi:MAG: VWA domain-containing protein [Candidatus Poribacteria bacterium]|nr:VWA domain-containing protein [Candidatus Poribacteria bacterium]